MPPPPDDLANSAMSKPALNLLFEPVTTMAFTSLLACAFRRQLNRALRTAGYKRSFQYTHENYIQISAQETMPMYWASLVTQQDAGTQMLHSIICRQTAERDSAGGRAG